MKTAGRHLSLVPNATDEWIASDGESRTSASFVGLADTALWSVEKTLTRNNGTTLGFELDAFRVDVAVPMEWGKSE